MLEDTIAYTFNLYNINMMGRNTGIGLLSILAFVSIFSVGYAAVFGIDLGTLYYKVVSDSAIPSLDYVSETRKVLSDCGEQCWRT